MHQVVKCSSLYQSMYGAYTGPWSIGAHAYDCIDSCLNIAMIFAFNFLAVCSFVVFFVCFFLTVCFCKMAHKTSETPRCALSIVVCISRRG